MATVLRRWGSGCLASSSSTASADLTHCASASPSPSAGKSSTSRRWRVGERLLRGARWRFYRSEHRIDRSASLLILHDFIFELCERGHLVILAITNAFFEDLRHHLLIDQSDGVSH